MAQDFAIVASAVMLVGGEPHRPCATLSSLLSSLFSLLSSLFSLLSSLFSLLSSLFSLPAILKNRQDEISLRMRALIVGLYDDWISNRSPVFDSEKREFSKVRAETFGRNSQFQHKCGNFGDSETAKKPCICGLFQELCRPKRDLLAGAAGIELRHSLFEMAL